MTGAFLRRRQLEVLRERQKGLCFWCQKPIGAYQATRDHIVPKSKGGIADLANLVLACRSCNGLRGDMDADSFRAVIAGRPA